MSRVGALVLIVFCLLPLLVNPVVAGNDDATPEVAAEWVQNYPEGVPDLSYAQELALGLYSTLRDVPLDYISQDWIGLFALGDDSALEMHFEKTFDSWAIDAADFALFAGHGNPFGFAFATNTDGDGIYPSRVHYSEVEWGDRDLEWIVIVACQVLNETAYPSVKDRWKPAFKGLHAIFGFHSSAYDVPLYEIGYTTDAGSKFVLYMLGLTEAQLREGQGEPNPYSIGYSWMCTTQDWQPSDVWGAMLAVWEQGTLPQWHDYLHGVGNVSSDVDNPTRLAYVRWQC